MRLIAEHSIAALVDMRTRPFSRWQPEFSMPAPKKRLGESYVWRKDLGGFGDEIAEESLDWLVEFGRSQNIVIMCSEGDPAKCHRHSKIATRLWLRREPVPVIHLRRDGTQSPAFEQGETAEPPPPSKQGSLFSLLTSPPATL